MNFRELATGLRFPEGPVAMDDGSVIVVEMGAGRITRIRPDGKTQTVASPGGGPNGLAIGPDGALYVCNNGGNFEIHERDGLMIPGHTPASHKGGRIERVDLSSGKVDVLYTACDGENLQAPNDLVFDQQGGFWFTDHGSTNDKYRTHGALYYAQADGSKITKVLRELLSPNGVGMSPHYKTVHYAETFPGRLWSLPLSGAWHSPAAGGIHAGEFRGRLSGARLFRFARRAGGRRGVRCHDPRGRHLDLLAGYEKFEHTPLPDLIVTNICWGGKDMNTAFVTMSSTGKLAAMEWRSPGLRLAYNA